MAAADTAPRSCSIASALEVVGERWTLLVLREIHYGVHRFDAIQRNTGAPRDVLTKRLNRLVEAGILERRQYSPRPPRFEYHATTAGHELRPVLLLLNTWGARWVPDRPQTRETFIHDCGQELEPVVACRACNRRVTGSDVSVHW
jgi:DNA-binding HxlR family transcriptional regulator